MRTRMATPSQLRSCIILLCTEFGVRVRPYFPRLSRATPFSVDPMISFTCSDFLDLKNQN